MKVTLQVVRMDLFFDGTASISFKAIGSATGNLKIQATPKDLEKFSTGLILKVDILAPGEIVGEDLRETRNDNLLWR